MEKLLASYSVRGKLLNVSRGEKVTGELVAKSEKELVLDIGAKAEGVLPVKDLSKEQEENLKVGDKIEAFVVMPENESGQITLSLYQSTGSPKGGRTEWSKFQNAQNKKSKLQGKVLEINKGGLIVEAGGTRGFLPNSQVGFELLSNLKRGLESLIGQNINVTVSEIDPNNNRLIFSQRGQVSEEAVGKIRKFKAGEKTKGKIVAVLPFGLVVNVDPSGGLGTAGVEGLVFISDVSWEKIDDLAAKFEPGQEVEAQVLGIDLELGRVNLSMKHLVEDPFAKIAQNYPVDEVVKGEITGVTEAGVAAKLSDGVEGFMAAAKMDPDTKYEVGQSLSFLVDSVDSSKRRINLAPFVTSTAGLIYK